MQPSHRLSLSSMKQGGEEIELSPELIKAYLVNGDADKVTDQEVMMYLNLCRFNT